ncbi:MAG: FHA domain-containing protein [Gemmataceae bacterium]|nr:FHA domain-containing protein [Gemmataceae bacterium]
MTKSSLNSVHLHALPRRQDYRRAREFALRARGADTIAAERITPTAIRTKLDARGIVRYVLVEGDAIFPLKVGLNTLGRFLDNDIVLGEGHISRRHCALVVHAGSGCELHDLASKNGTLLNGQRLTRPTWLVSGDQIRLCDRHFTFLTEDDAEQGIDSSEDSRTLCD